MIREEKLNITFIDISGNKYSTLIIIFFIYSGNGNEIFLIDLPLIDIGNNPLLFSFFDNIKKKKYILVYEVFFFLFTYILKFLKIVFIKSKRILTLRWKTLIKNNTNSVIEIKIQTMENISYVTQIKSQEDISIPCIIYSYFNFYLEIKWNLLKIQVFKLELIWIIN